MRELWANPEWVAARKHRRRYHQETL
jgi:hypothetical protein